MHADQHLDLVVVRRDVCVTEWPIETKTVAFTSFEVVRSVAQRDASPMIGATTEHPCPPPEELTTALVRHVHVGFARDLPSPIDSRIVEAKLFVGCRSTAQWRLLRRLKHRSFCFGGIIATGFQHEHARTFHGERVRSLPTCSA